MKYFFNELGKIKKKIKGYKILLCLDYDGTLTPIVKKPEYAKLGQNIKHALENIKSNKNIILAIISGRTLSGIKKLVNLRNVIYAGNHGFEIEIGRDVFIHRGLKEAIPIISKIKKAISKKIKGIRGAFIEDKEFTLSIHWRLVKKKYLNKLFLIIKNIIHNNSKIRLTIGKKVWEIRPNIAWDKGKAVELIYSKVNKNNNLKIIYIGDDTTDEDAFSVLKKEITIKIGKSNKSKAKYYLKKQSEIKNILNLLSNIG